ncbi:hypothetical protein L9F63_016835, partial [Diploptera punctata]
TSRNPLLREMYDRYLTDEKNIPKSIMESFHWVCNKDKYTTTGPDYPGRYEDMGQTCDMTAIPNAVSKHHTSFIVRKKSPYRGVLEYKMSEMNSNGVFSAIFQRNLKKKEQQPDEFTSVSLDQVTVIFVVLLAGIISSLIVLLLEIIMFYYVNT